MERDRSRVRMAMLGRATAELMAMLGTKKNDQPFTALDVFPELRDEDDDDADVLEKEPLSGEAAIVMAKIQAIAARQKAMAEA